MCSQIQSEYTYVLLYSSKAGLQMFPKILPVFSADKAHCTAPTKGTIFTIYGSNVNKLQIIIVLMFVRDNEKEHTWELFLNFINTSIKANWSGTSIIPDQDRGHKKLFQTYFHRRISFPAQNPRRIL